MQAARPGFPGRAAFILSSTPTFDFELVLVIFCLFFLLICAVAAPWLHCATAVRRHCAPLLATARSKA